MYVCMDVCMNVSWWLDVRVCCFVFSCFDETISQFSSFLFFFLELLPMNVSFFPHKIETHSFYRCVTVFICLSLFFLVAILFSLSSSHPFQLVLSLVWPFFIVDFKRSNSLPLHSVADWILYNKIKKRHTTNKINEFLTALKQSSKMAFAYTRTHAMGTLS